MVALVDYSRRRNTILLVEDEPSVRELLLDVLGDAGYTMVEARDGLEAIRALHERCPPAEHLGVVLLDMMLPGVDGLDVLRHLAAIGTEVPVVAMSASQQHLAAAASAGAHITLAKPFELDELLSTVASYCAPCT